MLSSKDILKKYDLSSVRVLFTGAAPLGKETAEELLRLFPKWRVGQGYGTGYSVDLATDRSIEWAC